MKKMKHVQRVWFGVPSQHLGVTRVASPRSLTHPGLSSKDLQNLLLMMKHGVQMCIVGSKQQGPKELPFETKVGTLCVEDGNTFFSMDCWEEDAPSSEDGFSHEHNSEASANG
eukprot:5087158-Amphidinium_carterae.1